ncbi:hypothetical protein ACFW9N_01565 [Streptomyces sp. NPDC059496]|uniref:hypothetical protein n=1 Tax=Streptomyces sp. NPDC059496 TaxID=3346851 RepID=UPI003679063D
MADMDAVAEALCAEIAGAQFSYAQSAVGRRVAGHGPPERTPASCGGSGTPCASAWPRRRTSPHERLQGVSSGGLQLLLWSQAGVNWSEYPDGCKRGRVAVRLTGERETAYVDRRTGREETTTAVRSWWETSAAPHFTTSAEGWPAATIPMMPSFAPAAV